MKITNNEATVYLILFSVWVVLALTVVTNSINDTPPLEQCQNHDAIKSLIADIDGYPIVLCLFSDGSFRTLDSLEGGE